MSTDETIIIKEEENQNEIQKLLSDREESSVSYFDACISILKFSFSVTTFFISFEFLILLGYIFINLENSNPKMTEAMGFSNLLFRLLLQSFLFGLFNGFDIMGSIAYGAKDYRKVGIYYWKGIIVSVTYSVVVTIIVFSFYTQIMTGLEFDEEVIHYGKRFTYIVFFTIFPELVFRANFIYLNISNRSYVVYIISLISAAISIPLSYILIIVIDIDTCGAALTMVIFETSNCLLSVLYIKITDPIPGAFICINSECFEDMIEYLKIGVPSSLLLAVESFGLQALSFVAVIIGKDVYLGHVAIFSVYNVANTPLLGFSIAILVNVSRSIGEKNIKNMKIYRNCCLLLGCGFQVILSLVLMGFHRQILGMFVEDEALIDEYKLSFFIMCCAIPLDMLQFGTNSFARSCGKFLQTTVTSISIFTVFMSSLALILGYVAEMNLFGIWLAFIISVFVLFAIYSLIIQMIDYKEVLYEMNNRNKRD